MVDRMTIPVFTCLVLGALVTFGGGYIIAFGRPKLMQLGSFTDQDVRALGLIHVLVGAWFLIGAATEDPNTTLGACLLMTKAKYCTEY